MAALGRIARHGGSVLLGQLAVIAFGITDTVVAGRHSAGALAALSVGSAIYISVFVGLIGVLQATLPVWAEMAGARRWPALGHSVRQSLWLAVLCALPGTAVLLGPGPLLRLADVPAALQDDVSAYLAVLAVSLWPALLFRLYSALNQALGRPLLVTWLQLGALALKVPLSVWFTFGGAGLNPHGVVGCAWATLVVTLGMVTVGAGLLRQHGLYRPLTLWRRPGWPDWPLLGGLARLGIPGGLAILVEVTSFTFMAIFIARLGAVAAAGHQIAASLASTLYMVPLSLGIATSAEVSRCRGAGQPAQARAAMRAGFALMAGMALGLATLLMLASGPLASLYARSPEVVAMAALLLPWVGVYHLADAVQALCVFVLRCYRVTLRPLLLYGVLLWGLGLSGGYLLVYQGWPGQPPWASPVGFWVTSSAALALTALAFVALLWHTVRRSGD